MENITTSIQKILQKNFMGDEVYVGPMRGASDDHLEVIVESAKFQGLGLLEQHQLVMNVLKEEFKDKLHAVKIKTKIK
jgi:stress-induced morphogen